MPRRRHAFSVPHRRSGSSDENPLRLVFGFPSYDTIRPPTYTRTAAAQALLHMCMLQSVESTQYMREGNETETQ